MVPAPGYSSRAGNSGIILSFPQAKNDAERGFLLENAVFVALRRGFNKIEYY